MLFNFLKNRLWPLRARHQWLEQPLATLPLLAVDLELTGLNARNNQIVSTGWLQGRVSSLDLGSAHHAYIDCTAPLNQSPVIHGITPSQLAGGNSLSSELVALSEFANSHLWVMHCHALDWRVLLKSYKQLQLASPHPVIIDTLLLERYSLAKSGDLHTKLDLSSCRRRYQLPNANAHNALDDAAATMELLFAQLSGLGLTRQAPLKALQHTDALVFI